MISALIGQVDFPAALVAVSLAFAIGVPITVAVSRYSSKAENERELLRLKAENARNQFNAETQRAIEMAKLEKNLITSHRAD